MFVVLSTFIFVEKCRCAINICLRTHDYIRILFFSHIISHFCFSLQSTVYRIVLLNGGLAEYEAVLAEYRNTEDNQVLFYVFLCSLLFLLF